jgi:hypothetical protein
MPDALLIVLVPGAVTLGALGDGSDEKVKAGALRSTGRRLEVEETNATVLL